MALNVVSSDRLSTNVKTSNLATGLSSKVGESKNIIINGAMVHSQRNGSSSVTPADTNYTLDRWRYTASQASKFTCQQNAGAVTPPADFSYYMGFTVASAVTVGTNDYFAIEQRVEGYNAAHLNLGTANAQASKLSFWVRSSLTGTFGGAIRGAGFARSHPFNYTISSANTWEKKTVTIAGDTTGTYNTTNGTSIGVLFSLGAGSGKSGTAGAWTGSDLMSATSAVSVVGTGSATWYVTGVQLEVGDTATEFEHRSYGDELARCQRYCVDFPINSQLGLGQVYSGSGYVQLPVALPVTMRTKPSVSKNGSYWFNSNIGNSGYSGDRSVTVETPAGSAHMYRLFVAGGSNQGNEATVWCQIHDAAGTYMRLEAEL